MTVKMMVVFLQGAHIEALRVKPLVRVAKNLQVYGDAMTSSLMELVIICIEQSGTVGQAVGVTVNRLLLGMALTHPMTSKQSLQARTC